MIWRLILAFSVLGAAGAISHHRAQDRKINHYITDGVITGGVASRPGSLINISKKIWKKQRRERYILYLGDKAGQPLREVVSYYHVNVDQNPARVEVDLDQVVSSGVNQRELDRLVQRSSLVTQAFLRFDPIVRTTSLLLKTKKGVGVEVFHQASKSKPGRIVVDLKWM